MQPEARQRLSGTTSLTARAGYSALPDLVLQNVAFAPPGLDHRTAGVLINFLAEPVDIDVDHIGKRIEAFVPYVLRDYFPAQDLAGMKDEQLQQRILLRGQSYQSAGTRGCVIAGIQAQFADLDHRRADPIGAPQ